MTVLRSVLMATMVFAASTTFANIFYKGKPVLGGSTKNCPIDITRILWGSDEMGSGDRIQGQIQI